MYEPYTRQSLPDKEYRELLGSAICVFNLQMLLLLLKTSLMQTMRIILTGMISSILVLEISVAR